MAVAGNLCFCERMRVMGSNHWSTWSTASAVCAGLVLHVPATVVAAGTVGVTTATNPLATGTPPSASMRTLRVGVDMFFNERVDTGPTGQTQVLFLDGS